MRVYKPTYTYKEKGKRKTKKISKWWIELRDHIGVIRRFPAFTDKGESEKVGRKIEKLVICNLNHEPPDRILSEWLEHIPEKLWDKLVQFGLLDSRRAAASKSLLGHLKDFEISLLAKGGTEKHAKQTTSRIKRVLEECGFVNWSDITASRVLQQIVKLRKYVNVVIVKKVNGKKVKQKELKDNGQISSKTANYYLKSMKQFCRWMVNDRRASESPVEHLQSINDIDIRHGRRALETDELRRLLETTLAQPKRFGMTGRERAILYRLAAETGLRRNEIKSLKKSSFNFSNCTVSVEIAYTKNKKTTVLPLRKATSAELQEFLAKKMPNAEAFKVPEKTADMMKEDLAAAKIPYVDDAGLFADFHALRHVTGSLLAKAGIHPKVSQSLMRHSDINLTMSRYTHIFRGQESEAVEKLPDLSLPSQQKQQALATGTDGKNDLSQNLSELAGQKRI